METQLTEVDGANTFRKRSGTTDRGHEFESIMVANLAMKLVLDREVRDFEISADHEAFGDFDDVVIESTSHDKVNSKIAIQLKHFQNKTKTLTIANLTTNSSNFSLRRYCASFNELGECRTNCKFLLLTNLKCKISPGQVIELKNDNIFIKMLQWQPNKLINTSANGRCYKFDVVSAGSEQAAEMYKNFFETFFLYTDQNHVDQLKEDVTRKFQQDFECSDEVVSKYFELVSNWSKLEGIKEKLNMEFMKNAIALYLLSPNIKPFPCGSVNNNFRILAKAISKFDVVVVQTKMEDIVKKMWTTTSCELKNGDTKIINKLVRKYELSSGASRNLNDTQCMKLLWLLRRCPLIVKGSASVYKALQLCQHKTIVIVDDESREETLQNCTSFRNLSSLKTYENIYSKLVEHSKYTFQGKSEISLKILLETNPELESKITVNDLLLMMDNSCRIGGDKEDLPTPYIDRRLKTHLIDINDLNRLDEETLIVISCVEQDKNFINSFRSIHFIGVQQYVKTGIKDSNAIFLEDVFPEHHQADELGVRKKEIYVSEKQCSVEQFNKICNRNSNFKKFHHFKINRKGLLEWVQSKGGTSDLEKYMNKHEIEEVELYSIRCLNNINLITADPGMGKSIILKSIKNNISPQFCTIILDPNDITLSCHKFKKINGKSEKIMKFIFSQKFKGTEGFEVTLLKLMREKHQVLVMWDALDEITSEALDITMNIILQLSRSGIKQFVTSRPHLTKTLESKFDLISRSICRFDTLQQKSFIKKRLVEVNCSEELFNTMTNDIIDNLYFAQHIDIIGVPLQIFMLTELIIHNSEKYYKKLAKMVSLSDLFAYFIEEKFNVHFYKKLNMDISNPGTEKLVTKLKSNAVKNFEAAAILLLMEEQFLQKLNVDSQDVFKKISDEEEWYGLLTSRREDGLPVFLHNSYAEFFVADYFARNYRNIPNIKDILFKEKYTNIRLLFDLILAKDSLVHIAAIYRNFENIQNCGDDVKNRDKGGRNPLQLACSWTTRHSILNVGIFNRYKVDTKNDTTSQGENTNNKNILEYLLNKCDPLEKDDIFDMDSLSYARMSRCLYAIGIIIKNIKFDNRKVMKDPRYISNIYYYSARFGYENLMNMFEIPIIITTTRGETLLHICAKYNQKLCLQQLLFSEKYKRIVNDRNEHGESPLHIACRYGHAEVVELLLQSNSNPDITSKNKWTPLHSACISGNLKIVHLLVQSGADINAVNESNLTPFHIAFLRKHEEILMFFKEVGLCKEEILNTGITSLHTASRMGDEKLVKSLIECGADIEATNKDGGTPLHSACYNGYKNVVEILLNSQVNIEAVSNYGETPLHSASYNGHTEVVKLLISSSANIASVLNDGRTPLHLASQKGHAEAVKLLIDAYASTETASKDGWTPLHLASSKGHAEIAKLLIMASANVEAASPDGRTPLHLASSKGHTDVVKLLITYSANIQAASNYAWTALHWACSKGHTEIVKLLIMSSANIEAAENDGGTPLHWACSEGHTEIVKLLIASWANIQASSNDGGTPLHVASSKGHTEVVKILITASANIEAPANDGRTSLHLASENGCTEVVKLLIAASANVEAVSKFGWTPLHCASSKGHTRIVKLLITASANVEAASNNGRTPLHLASVNGRTEVVKLLIAFSANIEATSNYGWTPLHRVSSKGHTTIVKLLIMSSANIEATSDDGWTPLHLASCKGHTEVVKVLITASANIEAAANDGRTCLHLASGSGRTGVVKLLIASSARIEDASEYGWTPLHWASYKGHTKIVKLLITFFANIETPSNEGATPLHWASSKGHTEVVKLLIASSANIEASCNDDWTPLHWASSNGRTEVVKLLIASSANIEAISNDGRTPLHLACIAGHLKIITFLLESGADSKVTDKYGLTPLRCAKAFRQLETVKLLSKFSVRHHLSKSKVKPTE